MADLTLPPPSIALPLATGSLAVVKWNREHFIALGAVSPNGNACVILLAQQAAEGLAPEIVDHRTIEQAWPVTGEFVFRAGLEAYPLYPAPSVPAHVAPLVIEADGSAWLRADDEHACGWVNVESGQIVGQAPTGAATGFANWSLWRTLHGVEDRVGVGLPQR